MKIAIVGAGDVAAYFIEEFSQSSHQTVVLSRSVTKRFQASYVEVRATRYAVDDLKEKLHDCDAIVSTLAGSNDDYTACHLAILEACIQSPKCKRYIPSAWTINMEDFPDQPLYLSKSRTALLEALRQQSTIKWSFICNGWFMDYIVSSSKRYLRDIGNEWIMDHNKKVFDLYGDGLQEITLTSVRDTAHATLALLEANDTPWSQFTYIGGQTLTPRELFAIVKKHDPGWKAQNVTLTNVLEDILRTMGAGEDPVLGALRLLSFTKCAKIPSEKVLKWNTGILAGVHGRDVQSFLEDSKSKAVP